MKVLISPDYGAGWSTWNTSAMATDKRLIEAFEKGISKEEMEQLCIDLGYGEYICMLGFEDLEVVEVPKGVLFQIREYDGNEYIEIFEAEEWIYSE